jgi:hypothetical protein
LGLNLVDEFDDQIQIYNYYTSLELERSYRKFIMVNGVFTMRLFRELQDDLGKIISLVATKLIKKYGSHFI